MQNSIIESSDQKRCIVENANGKQACLIYCTDGKYRVRIYDNDKKSMFKDYDICINDLFFTITDEDATIYETDDKFYIDNSPETLGIKYEK